MYTSKNEPKKLVCDIDKKRKASITKEKEKDYRSIAKTLWCKLLHATPILL